jgi:hypothetical protein
MWLLKISLFVLCLTPSVILAQTTEHTWREADKITEISIPEQFKQEDAIIIQKDEFIRIEVLSFYKFKVTETTIKRVKILNENGLNVFSTFYTRSSSSRRVTTIDARTIKADGSVVDFNANDLKQISTQSKYELDREVDEFRVAIPGVEVGDVVEYIISFETDRLMTGRDVILNDYLASLKSNFTLSVSNRFTTSIASRNGLPAPEMEEDMNFKHYKWSMNDLVPLNQEYFAIVTNEIPYLSFALRQYISATNSRVDEISKSSWVDLYDAYLFTYQDKLASGVEDSKYFDEWFLNTLKGNYDRPKTDQLFLLFMDISENLEVKELSPEDSEKSIGFFLKHGYIDNKHLKILYRKIFERFELPYHVCFYRSKYDGTLDEQMIATHMVTDIFYGIDDANGDLRFIFPSTSSVNFHFDELPWFVQGTTVAVVSKKQQDALKATTTLVRIPSNSYKSNYHKSRVQASFNLKNGKQEISWRGSYAGTISSLQYKKATNSLKEGKGFFTDNLKVEMTDTAFVSEQSTEFPYKFAYGAELDTTSELIQIDDSTYSLELDHWINHKTITLDRDERYFDVYLPYAYSDELNYYLTFDQDIELLNGSELETSLSLTYGNYVFSIKQVNSRTISILSRLIYLTDYIPKTEFEQLKKIDSQVKKINKSSLLLGL